MSPEQATEMLSVLHGIDTGITALCFLIGCLVGDRIGHLVVKR